MQGKYLKRVITHKISRYLSAFPAVALLGPRQSGKSTLAKHMTTEMDNAIYLDLEKPSDHQKLNEPEIFFNSHQDKLICLDEIQRTPEIFAVLRSIIDQRNRNGQFLMLGSASRALIKQSSETLAGRIVYLELTPFQLSELVTDQDNSFQSVQKYWMRGGFPRSYLADDDDLSMVWRQNFILTFLERDIPQLGFHIPVETLRRLWQMCAHCHGQLLNQSMLGESIGVSHTTIRSYLDLLTQTFMIRVLKPYQANIKKRLVKSPKIFIRDSGILHSLLNIDSFDDLLGNPVYGRSWEGMGIENIIAKYSDWDPYFYRTAAGAEIDLVLVKGSKKIGFEFKASAAPRLTKGFWHAFDDLGVDEAYVISPVRESYSIHKHVQICNLKSLLSQ